MESFMSYTAGASQSFFLRVTDSTDCTPNVKYPGRVVHVDMRP